MVLGHPALEFLLAINFQNFAYKEGCVFNYLNRVYERDVFMCASHCMDLKKRLGATEIHLPQVFIHGHLLGVSKL